MKKNPRPGNDLAKRWTKEKAMFVEREFQQPKIDKTKLSHFVGTVHSDGVEMLDLRGFPFQTKYRDKEVTEIDFSESTWEPLVGLKFTRAVRCCFAKSTFYCSVFRDANGCSFVGTKLTDIAGVPETTYQACNFLGASFQRGKFLECTFENCTFTSAKFKNTEFEECIFDQCDFSACSFKGCSFGGSRFLRSKNNFRYNQYLDDSIELTEKIFNPKFEMVDFKDTLMGKVQFD
jgi:uncharacterized protein YjbI with pentapeptide repeats